MKRYYFTLMDEKYNELDAFIPDGSHKQSAVNYARKWMKDNNIQFASLDVSSIRTGNLLDVIDISISD